MRQYATPYMVLINLGITFYIVIKSQCVKAAVGTDESTNGAYLSPLSMSIILFQLTFNLQIIFRVRRKMCIMLNAQL